MAELKYRESFWLSHWGGSGSTILASGYPSVTTEPQITNVC